MSTFILDPRLAADSHHLGSFGDAELLLINNAHYPWLVLVPHTCRTEFFELDHREQRNLLTSINSLSAFIKQLFSSDKLNVATIGNIVNQLHIHVIGRCKNDPSWPNVVWGATHSKAYDRRDVYNIISALESQLSSHFIKTTKWNQKT